MKRVVLKISGEALAGKAAVGINYDVVAEIAKEIKELYDLGNIQISIVVGAGNMCRGRAAVESGMNRVNADYMGMLATIMNSMAIQGALENLGLKASVMTSFSIPVIADTYSMREADKKLTNGEIVIFGGGTGNPFFSTDTCAALRAAELKCDMILMAKNGTDGVYDKDPRKDKTAKKFTKMTQQEVVERGLQVMDLTAATICSENNVDIYVFDMNQKGNIAKAASDYSFGTLITNK